MCVYVCVVGKGEGFPSRLVLLQMYYKVAQRGFPHSSSLSWQLPCVSWSLGRHVGALMRRTARLFVSKGQAYSWEMTRMCVVRGGGGGGGAGLRAFLVNHESTQSDGWGLVSFHSCPQFRGWTDLKEIKLLTVCSGISEQIKLLKPVGRAEEFKLEPKFKPQPVIWHSLPEAFPEDNLRFWLQNQ